MQRLKCIATPLLLLFFCPLLTPSLKKNAKAVLLCVLLAAANMEKLAARLLLAVDADWFLGVGTGWKRLGWEFFKSFRLSKSYSNTWLPCGVSPQKVLRVHLQRVPEKPKSAIMFCKNTNAWQPWHCTDCADPISFLGRMRKPSMRASLQRHPYVQHFRPEKHLSFLSLAHHDHIFMSNNEMVFILPS